MGTCNIEQAELCGILDGLQLAWNWGFKHVVMETDNKNIVDRMNETRETSCGNALLNGIMEMRNKRWHTLVRYIHRKANMLTDHMAKRREIGNNSLVVYTKVPSDAKDVFEFDRSGGCYTRHTSSSMTWKSIRCAQKLLKDGLCWRVGNGTQIQPWVDRWVPSIPDNMITPKLGCCKANAGVSDFIDSNHMVCKTKEFKRYLSDEDALTMVAIPLPTSRMLICLLGGLKLMMYTLLEYDVVWTPKQPAEVMNLPTWSSPSQGWFKVNFNARYCIATKNGYSCILIRGYKGTIKVAAAISQGPITSLTTAEAQACFHAIQLANAWGLRRYDFEGDLATVITSVTSPYVDRFVVAPIIDACKNLLSSFDNPKFNFTKRVNNLSDNR